MKRISKVSIKYIDPPKKSSFDYKNKNQVAIPTEVTYHKDMEIVIKGKHIIKYNSKKTKSLLDNKFYILPNVTSESYSDLDLETLSSILHRTMLHQSNNKVKLLSKAMVKGAEKKMLQYFPGIRLAYAKNKSTSFLMSYSINFPDERYEDTRPVLLLIEEIIETPWPFSFSERKFAFKNKG